MAAPWGTRHTSPGPKTKRGGSLRHLGRRLGKRHGARAERVDGPHLERQTAIRELVLLVAAMADQFDRAAGGHRIALAHVSERRARRADELVGDCSLVAGDGWLSDRTAGEECGECDCFDDHSDGPVVQNQYHHQLLLDSMI